MATFPENDVEILPDYFPAAPVALVASGLAAAGVTPAGAIPLPGAFTGARLTLTPAQRSNQQRAATVHAARRRLRSFLTPSGTGTTGTTSREITTITALEEISDHFKRRQFVEADEPIRTLLSAKPVGSAAPIDRQTISTALTRTDIPYFVIEVQIIPGPGPDREREIMRKVGRTLKGYRGPAPRADQGELLAALPGFLTGGPERRFRLRLLLAERLVGEARAEEAQSDPEALFNEAIRTYASLLPSTQTSPATPLSAQQKLVVMRSATAQVALGDFLYRRAFRPGEAQRDGIVAVYQSALELLLKSGMGTDKLAALALHIDQQLQRLRNGVNMLGYTDSFVPSLKLKTLSTRALDRIDAAEQASQRFRDLEQSLDAVLQEIAGLEQQALERQLGGEIARLREASAVARAQQASVQRKALEDKREFLDLGLAASLGPSLFATLGLGPADQTESEGTTNGPGPTSVLVDYLGQKTDLGHQARIAELEEQIAGRDLSVARLERDIARSQAAFVQDTLVSRQFRANRLYALTNAWEELTRRQVAGALESLFLFERGIVFRRFKDLEIVQGGSSDPLLAPGPLREMQTRLVAATDADGKGQNAFTLPPISLRTRYPIEYHRFLQEGQMEFVISLYDVEKHLRLNGHCNIRIKSVEVLVSGLVPASGFIGTLVHRGVMMFRDSRATMSEPRPERLVPSADEVEAAVRELARGTALRATVGGVALLALDQDTRRFSSEPEVSFPDDELDFDLEPIENYGLTGTWLLKIDGMNVRNLLDVRLRFTISLEERDPALEARVDELIAIHEELLRGEDRLDRTQAFSLRGRFPDAFFELETGQATFVLREEDFDPTITDLKVKMVVAQALDGERSGVEGLALEISKPGATLALARTTGPDGFSEDVAGEIPTVPGPERPPVHGAWQLRLADPGQFSLLGQGGDLQLFFVYEFRPSGSPL